MKLTRSRSGLFKAGPFPSTLGDGWHHSWKADLWVHDRLPAYQHEVLGLLVFQMSGFRTIDADGFAGKGFSLRVRAFPVGEVQHEWCRPWRAGFPAKHPDCLDEELLGHFGWKEDLKVFLNTKVFGLWSRWLAERPNLLAAQEMKAMEQLL